VSFYTSAPAYQVLGGARQAAIVRAVAPAIEGKLLYLCPGRGACVPTAARAGGEIPSRARVVGAGLRVIAGRWFDTPGDSAYVAPTPHSPTSFDRPHPRAPTPPGVNGTFNFIRR
jgi:hypothetical protein